MIYNVNLAFGARKLSGSYPQEIIYADFQILLTVTFILVEGAVTFTLWVGDLQISTHSSDSLSSRSMYSVFSFEYSAGLLHLADDKMYFTFLFHTHLFCIPILMNASLCTQLLKQFSRCF